MKFEFEITRRCNFSCLGCDRLCNIIKDINSDITLEETKKIIDEINSRNEKLEHFVVIGGEPTLNPECYEICKYIKENLKRCCYFALATNHSNEDIAKKISSTGFKIRKDDYSTEVRDILINKINKHFNILISPKEKGFKVGNPKKCWILNNCSISIHKYRGNIKYCWCGAGSSICKLLMKEDFMKDSLEELLNSDRDKYLNEICPNCMYLSYEKILVKDSKDEISECFKKGLNKIKME